MPSRDGYRLYLNPQRTILLRIWDTGRLEIAQRPDPDHTWGPPVELYQQRSR
jgi:hypothetical protein